MVDKRKSPDYQELRGFIPISLVKKFKAVCKGLGQNINDSLEEAVKEWINKQEQIEHKEQKSALSAICTGFNLPSIASAIEETLKNEEWKLNRLSDHTGIPVFRLQQLLSGELATDSEISSLSLKLFTSNGHTFDREDLIDMRLVDELKQRLQKRELERQRIEQLNKNHLR